MLRAQLKPPEGQEEYNKHAMMNTTMGSTTERQREREQDGCGGGGHSDGGQAASYSRLLWTHPQCGQPDALPRPEFADASW